MRIERVDERDSNWEEHDPRFRVYFFEGGDTAESSWSAETFDVTGADVLEVIGWAQEQAGAERLFAVALIGEDDRLPPGRRHGLTWLVGMDANDTPGSETEKRCLMEMLARRGKRIIAPSRTSSIRKGQRT
ncbi:hypothetical protein ABZ639_09750 [Saccharomonospora sp. NPDC006951]